MTRNPLVWLACAGVCASASAQQFFPIVDPANPLLATRGVKISADGQTVIGTINGTKPTSLYGSTGIFRWTAQGGYEKLSDQSAFPFSSMYAADASDVGSTIIGTYQIVGEPIHEFRYTDSEGFVRTDTNPDPSSFSSDRISGDGTIFAGVYRDPVTTYRSAAIMHADGTIQSLGLFGPNPPLTSSSASGISYDGSVVVGTSSSETSTHNPFLWTEASGLTRITTFDRASAQSVSRDGQWVVGRSYDSVPNQSFRWSQSTGTIMLGNIPGFADHVSVPRDISDDGSVIVGIAQPGMNVAFLWTETAGMRNLQSFLEDSYGLDLTGWQLNDATSISADGTTITGYAYDPDGIQRAFVAILPAHCPADTNGDGMLTPADFTAWIAAFNAQAPECDQNADGLCTPADFTAWIFNYNAGC